MRFLFHVLPCLVLLLASAPTSAESDSAIFGTVIDVVTRKPVQYVVVAAYSPAIPGEKNGVTDEQGRFRISHLPAGSYALHFENEHYDSYKLKDLQLLEGRSLRAHVELVPVPLGPATYCY